MLGLSERHLFLDREPKRMHSARFVRGWNRANGTRLRDEPTCVHLLSGRNVLPGRHDCEGVVRPDQLGRRSEFGYSVHCANELHGRPIRDECRFRHHEPHVRELRERNVQRDKQCRKLLGVDDLRSRHLREPCRQWVERSSLRGVPERDLHEHVEPKYLSPSRRVPRRDRANGRRLRDKPAHVHGVCGRNVLPGRHDREGVVR